MHGDSIESSRDRPETSPRWLLLIHQIPPKPDYLRVKVSRRLRRIGAQAIKNSVYVLPFTDEALEDFEWLRGEIVADGGEAVLCEASFIEGLSNREVTAMFEPEESAAGVKAPTGPPRGATWVTRRGVKVDRIASAWLVRRFIDPEARFKFVPARGYEPSPGEVRFDMFQAEYTHEGDACTFETLVARFGLEDPALQALAEMVHDIDCKEERFGRPETAGFAALISGIVSAHATDEARVERGSAMLDDFHAELRRTV